MSSNIPQLPARSQDCHKGHFGRALLIGGSKGMSGAISISALGALRCGTGLTTVATAESCWAAVAASQATLMTMPLPADRRGRISGEAWAKLSSVSKKFTAIAIGPGMGQSLGLRKIVEKAFVEFDCPVILDADALTLLSTNAQWSNLSTKYPRILTPHPGEFERLSGVKSKDRDAQIHAARNLSATGNLVVLLKGNRTAICSQGEVLFNATGNPKMAVGGSGDLLTGMILAFLCQGLSPLDSARLGCHLHGVAGDLAAARLGCPSVLPSDVIEDIPNAFNSLRALVDANSE